MKISSNKIIFSIILLLAISTGAGYIFIFSIINKNLDSSTSLASDLEMEKRRNTQFQTARQIIVDTAKDRENLDSFFVSSRGVVEFLDSLESFANETGLEIEIVSVGIEELKKNEEVDDRAIYENLKVNINSGGTWLEHFHFLSLLENLPIKMEVTKFTMEKQSDERKVISFPWSGSFSLEAVKLK